MPYADLGPFRMYYEAAGDRGNLTCPFDKRLVPGRCPHLPDVGFLTQMVNVLNTDLLGGPSFMVGFNYDRPPAKDKREASRPDLSGHSCEGRNPDNTHNGTSDDTCFNQIMGLLYDYDLKPVGSEMRPKTKKHFLLFDVLMASVIGTLVLVLAHFVMTRLISVDSVWEQAVIVVSVLQILPVLIASRRLAYQIRFSDKPFTVADNQDGHKQKAVLFLKVYFTIMVSSVSQIFAMIMLFGRHDVTLGIGFAVVGLAMAFYQTLLMRTWCLSMPRFKRMIAQAADQSHQVA